MGRVNSNSAENNNVSFKLSRYNVNIKITVHHIVSHFNKSSQQSNLVNILLKLDQIYIKIDTNCLTLNLMLHIL